LFVRVLSAEFWNGSNELVRLTEHVLKVLRLADSPVPTMGKVYRAIELALLEIEYLELPVMSEVKRQKVLEALYARKDFILSDLHCAGYVLDPEFMSHNQGEDLRVMEGWLRIVEKLIPRPEHRVKCLTELGIYKSGGGIFGRPLVRDAAKSMQGHIWWREFGSVCPTLQPLAIKVLAQCSSACGCERNWSTFDFIHSKKRNRLSVERRAI
jgi:hypothetical protein